jgi:hypothetical protein
MQPQRPFVKDQSAAHGLDFHLRLHVTQAQIEKMVPAASAARVFISHSTFFFFGTRQRRYWRARNECRCGPDDRQRPEYRRVPVSFR